MRSRDPTPEGYKRRHQSPGRGHNGPWEAARTQQQSGTQGRRVSFDQTQPKQPHLNSQRSQ